MSGQLHTMDAPPPAFTAEDATWITWQKYGIRCMARVLAGERDLNFRMTDAERRDSVLKIWNSTQDPAVIQFQLGAIRHIAASGPDLPVARVMPGIDGQDCLLLKDSEGRDHPAAMLTWLEGMFLREARITDPLKASLGRAMARLDLALSDFSHPAQERDLVWDISKVLRLRVLAEDIPPGTTRDRVSQTLDRFEAHTAPVLEGLRRQVVHNDLNPDNVLVDPGDQVTVTGIIDFGDVLHAPLVCELAIACAYLLSGDDDPLDDILPVVTAYHGVFPLQAAELDVLLDLVGARLLCTLLISTRMARLFPENRDYLLGDNPLAERRLVQLESVDRELARRRVRAACGLQ
jgi:Ser/Thr protein kinase RdoA (MazF antagonist)